MPTPQTIIKRPCPSPVVGAGQWGEVQRAVYFGETNDATLTELFLDGTADKRLLMNDGDFIHLCQVYIAGKSNTGNSWAKWYDNTKYHADKFAGVVTVDGPGIGGPGNAGGTGAGCQGGIDAEPGNTGLRAQVQGIVLENWKWIVVIEYIRVSNS